MNATLIANRASRLEALLQEVWRQHPAEAAGFSLVLTELNEAWQAGQEGRMPRPSLLTPCGFPFELNARSDSRELCYTAEPAAPGAGWTTQLSSVRRLTGIDLAADPALAVFLQQPAPRFGCWLSMRHSKDITAGKAYLETGPSTHQYFSAQLHAACNALPQQISFLPMLAGVYPGVPGISEYYVRLLHPDAVSLQSLFAACDAGNQLPLVLSVLGELAAQQASVVLTQVRLGASIRMQPGKHPAVTLFLHAPQLFRDNLHARTRILALARHLGGALPLYEAISASLLVRPVAQPLHSVVSLKIGSRSLSCSVGYSPATLE
ncbi:MAG: hypothetical protein EOO15_03695 [Chitinophagaceae bacterium]|nr:MAG: hypothetical protein EOO15_03695 [Chitinophagaceae bacterium]